MQKPTNLTRRAALATALGLSLAPMALVGSAAARGGPDPWKPRCKTRNCPKRKRRGVPKEDHQD